MLPVEIDAQYSDLRADTLYFIRSDVPARFTFPARLSFVVLRFNDVLPPEEFRTGAKLVIVDRRDGSYCAGARRVRY